MRFTCEWFALRTDEAKFVAASKVSPTLSSGQ